MCFLLLCLSRLEEIADTWTREEPIRTSAQSLLLLKTRREIEQMRKGRGKELWVSGEKKEKEAVILTGLYGRTEVLQRPEFAT